MKSILSLLAVVFASTVWAQSFEQIEEKMYNNAFNFYDVVKEAEEYFNSIDKEAKGSGYKTYMRWKYNNEYKYYPTGERKNVAPYFVENEYLKFKLENNNSARSNQNQWHELGPSTIDSITGHYSAGLGRIEDMYANPNNPNLLYLGSRSGGFWRSSDEGKTWLCTTDTMIATGVNTFSVSPFNPDSVIINLQNARNNTSFGAYISNDGGITWQKTNFNPTNLGVGGLGSNFKILEIAYHPRIENMVYVATDNGLYISKDNLQSWTHIEPNYDFKELAFHPANDSIIYAYNSAGTATSNQVLISKNLGYSFTTSNFIQGNNGNKTVELVTSPPCADCLWFGSSNGVWVSYNQGLDFKFLSNPTESCHGFSVSDVDTSVMIYGYVDLDASTDGGRTFTDKTAWSLGNTNASGFGHAFSFKNSTNYIHADLRNAKCVQGVFYVVTDGYLCKSTDNGNTWQILSDGVGTRENYCLGASQSNHFRTIAGSQDNGTSINTEQGWVEFYGADGMEGIIHPLNHDYMLGSVQYGSRRLTKNGGLTQQGATPRNADGAYWVAPLAINPNHHFQVYDFRDSIYFSEDFSANHKVIGHPNFAGDIQVAAIAENNSKIIVIANNSFISKSIDGGKTFTNIKNNLPNYAIRDIAFNPKNDDNIFVVYGRYQADNQKIYMTTDGGNQWTNITANLGSMPISSVVVDHSPESNIYVGAEIGVYTKKLNETQWKLYSNGLPNMDARELEIVYGSNTLRCATWGRGLWETNLVGKENYPKIMQTTITNPPTLNTPKTGVEQYVTSEIVSSQTLNSAYVKWSRDTPIFNQTIPMQNTQGNFWKTTASLPDFPEGTLVYFKVFAINNQNDTSETYKFMYEVKPFEICKATGNDGSGNLYIQKVEMEDLNHTSNNEGYSHIIQPILSLYADSTYQLYVEANTGWQENDFAAWIDFNHDATFDETERILFAPNQGKDTLATFTVPSNIAFNQMVTMRIRLSYWGRNPEPCDDQFGEVEDYSIFLLNGAVGMDKKEENDSKILVYPNPTKENIHLQFNHNQQPYLVQVLDISGRVVLEKNAFTETITLQHRLNSGNYVVRVVQGEKEYTTPIIVKNQ